MPHAVEPFVPSRHVPYEDLPLDDPPRELSCGGDFADPQLDQEMRRFLFRDLVRFVMYASNAVNSTLIVLLTFSTLPVVLSIAFSATAAVVEGIFFFTSLSKKPWAPTVRLVCTVVQALTGLCFFDMPSIRSNVCGADRVAAAASNVTSAAFATAVADRQQYCIDVVDWWLAGYVFTNLVTIRMFPQHIIPCLLLTASAYAAGYLIRTASTADNPYDTNVGAIATDLTIQAAVCATLIVFAVRWHASERQRFIATARAERAQRLALAEMRSVDQLLQRALPQVVLARMVD